MKDNLIIKVLEKLNITALNAMQTQSIEANKKHSDVLLLSPTGTGKTLAFLLPIFERLNTNGKSVQAIIIVPSRELAIQIESVFKQMGTGFKINCCYGGHSTRIERNNFEQMPAVLVGTPGRLAYHMARNHFTIEALKTLVLDEFDKSLEFGFKDDMEFIISKLKHLNRRILTSATPLDEIPNFVGAKDVFEVNFLNKNSELKVDLTLKIVKAKSTDKLEALYNLVCHIENASTIIFCNHRDAVDRISDLLWKKGLANGLFHGGMDQDDRERALIKFRNGSHHFLITTDLAARGLDIPDIKAIVHYQLPISEDAFIHRNGRTARMQAKGTAYILLGEDEKQPDFISRDIEEIKLVTKNKLPEAAQWRTLYIAAGKKDKINKMDIVGLVLQKGKIGKDDLGKIEVLDNSAYAAIKTEVIERVVTSLQGEKIKNKKVKMVISN
jgi:superfamily II DNA/RNA helicase